MVDGFLHIPLALVLLIVSTGAWGCWGFLRQWNRWVEVQLRLDRCSGEAALHFKSTMNRIEGSNRRMQAVRAALAAATLAPQAAALLRAELQAEVLLQENGLAQWNFRRLRWAFGRSCGGGDSAPPLPNLEWKRPPPDPLGPRPLEWFGGIPANFYVRMDHAPRHAAARIYRNGGLNEWKTEWVRPDIP